MAETTEDQKLHLENQRSKDIKNAAKHKTLLVRAQIEIKKSLDVNGIIRSENRDLKNELFQVNSALETTNKNLAIRIKKIEELVKLNMAAKSLVVSLTNQLAALVPKKETVQNGK
jgi:hypothetical protein